MTDAVPSAFSKGDSVLQKVAKIYLRIVEIICVALLILILGCMCVQIVCRIFSIGQNFTEELSRLCFSLMIFVGAPLALAEGEHIAVDMVVKLMPVKVRRGIEALASALTAVFCVLCMKSQLVVIGSNLDVRAVSITWIHMNWLYVTFFLSFAVMLVISAVTMVCAVLGKSTTLDIHKEEKELARKQESEVDLGL